MRAFSQSLLVFLLWSSVIHASQVDLGNRISSTPYDHYLSPVREVYARMKPASVSIDEVRSNLRTARRFQYFFDNNNPYRPLTPAVTEAKQAGDCKAKSLWLANKIQSRQSRYVIGKYSSQSQISHAWLLWSWGGVWYVLDPTNEYDVLKADQLVGTKHFAHYSYNHLSNYVHPTYSNYFK